MGIEDAIENNCTQLEIILNVMIHRLKRMPANKHTHTKRVQSFKQITAQIYRVIA